MVPSTRPEHSTRSQPFSGKTRRSGGLRTGCAIAQGRRPRGGAATITGNVLIHGRRTSTGNVRTGRFESLENVQGTTDEHQYERHYDGAGSVLSTGRHHGLLTAGTCEWNGIFRWAGSHGQTSGTGASGGAERDTRDAGFCCGGRDDKAIAYLEIANTDGVALSNQPM